MIDKDCDMVSRMMSTRLMSLMTTTMTTAWQDGDIRDVAFSPSLVGRQMGGIK
jgi:hypothetical protein